MLPACLPAWPLLLHGTLTHFTYFMLCTNEKMATGVEKKTGALSHHPDCKLHSRCPGVRLSREFTSSLAGRCVFSSLSSHPEHALCNECNSLA
uniref:Putative secreted protein n=1 Tax=Anopheles marajoara TaxID=58244 RepID=A0A2M4C9J2_9DIPT